ncbi:MAG TPA: cyclase family protein [Cyclobacteriaceae bacterium]|nr:cyclase family protein [Cyclobacteriaceae bacterium]
MKRLIDLSHTIEHGMITYKGLPAPIICDYLSREASKSVYDGGATFQIGKIEMVANTGTYLDVPFHRYEDGKDLSQVELERFVNIPAVVVHTHENQIGTKFFEKQDVRGKAVLVHTGWSKHWRTDQYFEQHPSLTKEAAEYLKQQGVNLVGIDSHNIDDTRTKLRPVHTILLGAGILIVEHLCNLDQLPDKEFLFTAVPPKFKGVGTFPVRAFATEL